MSASPWRLTTAELHAAFAAGETTPGAALDACLERLAAVNPLLNAVVTLDEAGARAAAAESTARWQAGTPRGALDGVPLTVKDNLFVGGMRATWGSRLYAEHVAPRDDIPVARLRAAGAVIIGKTNTPELALAGFTDNPVFGSTGNPWAPDLSPGGSSGGAVAAVAAGIGPLALATDAGGSLRRPAGHAGVATIKPGIGRVPRRHGFPPLAQDFQVIGPIARCVADLRAAFEVLADPALPFPAWPSRLRLRAVEGCGDAPVDPAVRAVFAAALAGIAALGHEVETVAAPWDPDEVGALFATLAAAGVARVVAAHPGWAKRVTPAIRSQAEAGLALTAADYVRATDRVASLRAELVDWVRAGHAVLTPSSAIMPWPRDKAFPPVVDGRPAGPRAGAIFSTVVNLAGLPAVVIPAGCAASGLPVGLQIIGPPGSETALLDLAAVVEAARPWRRLAPLEDQRDH
jgi:aspartyl-tRNA(Asn)/glutamyl-tRNA(Gln) amidotransferase subunit A